MTKLSPASVKSIKQAKITLETATYYEDLEDVIYFIKKAILTNKKYNYKELK